MRCRNKVWIVLWGGLVAAALVAAAACTSGALDEGESADVVLQVQQVTIPPVQGQSDGAGGCVFTVTESTATLAVAPKSGVAQASSPFNDVLVESLTISYAWDDPALDPLTPPVTTSPRVVIPVDGTNQVRFLAVQAGVLDASFEGRSAELTLLFAGRTGDGKAVQALGGGSLVVHACLGGS